MQTSNEPQERYWGVIMWEMFFPSRLPGAMAEKVEEAEAEEDLI